MSDLPPDKAAPRDPRSASATPHWAMPAVPPAPELPPAQGVVSPAQVAMPAAQDASAQQPATPAPAAWTPAIAAPAPAPSPWTQPSQAPAPVPAYAEGQTAPWAPAQAVAAPAPRAFQFNLARWLPSGVVAAIIAAVVLGGMGIDTVVAAPSAGTVTVGGSVTITAAPGWILVSTPGDTSNGIELQKANAILIAEVVSESYSGDSASLLPGQEQSLTSGSAQISFGDSHKVSVGGHDTTYVAFEETIASGGRSGILDGELVCMVVGADAVVILAAAPQGGLEAVVDDVSAMLKSVGAGR